MPTNNKVYGRTYMAERRRRLRDRANEYKTGLRCADCGEDFGPCLDLHHSDPSTKEFEISDAIQTARYTWERIKKEIDKCVVVCANCHRKRHYLLESSG